MAEEERADIIEADDEPFSDEGADVGDGMSSLTSLSSSIVKGIEENGRTYASYGKEEYGAPMDEAEMDRIDMAHAKYYILLEKRRFLSPLKNPQKVLDLGCGTGIWCIDFADDHPSADVTGVDIAPIQPKWTPPNLRFEVDDIEQVWTWRKESFDFIFARDLLLCIRDHARLVRQCYEYLKPGGWLEFQAVHGRLGCDDGTFPEESQFRKYDELLNAASTSFGTPMEDPERYAKWFEEAGFQNVSENIFKMPTSPWAKDPRLQLVGAFEQENLTVNLEGISQRVFHKGLGWSVEEVTVFCAEVRKDIRNRRSHTYYPFYVVYAQKPFGTPSTTPAA